MALREQKRVVHEDFDVEDVLSQLDTEEKIALLSGTDFWHTASISRLNVPAIRLSDGPNGVRGTKFFNGTPAACLPCGTAMAATWNTELIELGGSLQGHEAIAKGASVILGPTTNMQRGPLGGRGFESFSEDPVLAGNMSTAVVKGIQSTGVAATLKHFVCNDQEHERQRSNSILSERALREIYLLPFQIAQRDAKPWSFMTSYNRVNGIHASECPRLLNDILRTEWGFDGMIMSDWFGTYSTVEAIKAGLDLEMPAPSLFRASAVNHALGCGKLTLFHIDSRVREILKFVKKVLPLGIPEDAPEGKIDTPETADLLRKIATEAIVLLKNENGLLPLKKNKSTAVIGSNAQITAYCGGGSAALPGYYAVSPLQGIRNHVSDAKFALGAPGWKKLPFMSHSTTLQNSQVGMEMRVYLEPPAAVGRQPIDQFPVRDSLVLLMDYKHPQITSDLYWVELEGQFTPDETSEYELSLSCAGTGKLFVDGNCVVDNETKQVPGDSFFGSGTRDEINTIYLEKDKTYTMLVKFATLPTITFKLAGVTMFGAGGFRVGMARKVETKSEIARAVSLAKSVDQVVLVCGLNGDWESEGYDRRHMDLPSGTDELIHSVLAANRNTVIVNQSGTPVTMPWLESAPAIIQAWYGGNETGNAIADVVFGAANPSGKLSLTFPLRNEDNPAFLNFRSEKQRILYGEDIYIGYRYYEKTNRQVAFPFGHGLSYSTFECKNLNVQTRSSDEKDQKDDGKEEQIIVTVDVQNTSSTTAGAEVIQVYISPLSASVGRPTRELKGFQKVHLESGETKTVEVRTLKKYACSFWDEERDAWCVEKGTYVVGLGGVGAHLKKEFEVDRSRWWRGL